MRDFLFHFLILKWYSNAENIFFLGNKIKVSIEIPKGFINYLEEFPILKLFKQHSISINNLPPLKVDRSLSSHIQIVANYLNLLDGEEINQKDIMFPDLSPDFIEKNKLFAQEIEQTK